MARKYADLNQTIYLGFVSGLLVIAGVVMLFVGGNATTKVDYADVSTPNIAVIVGGAVALLIGALSLVAIVLFSMWRAERWNIVERAAPVQMG